MKLVLVPVRSECAVIHLRVRSYRCPLGVSARQCGGYVNERRRVRESYLPVPALITPAASCEHPVRGHLLEIVR